MKAWETPKLIVLVRNNPQEAVLDACKGISGLAAGVVPASDFTDCRETLTSGLMLCMDCFSITTS